MRLPAIPDATVRYLILTSVGVLLLAVLPATALGDRPLWRVLGHPGPTAAHLFGIVPIVAAWVYFVVVVVVKRSAWSRGALCRAILIAGWLGLLLAVVALMLGARQLGVVVLLFVVATHLGVAARLGQAASGIDRSGPGAGAGLP